MDTFDGPMAAVLKTARFTGGRRIGVSFLPTREGHRDGGMRQYAGSAVFRELVQHADGTLGTCFPPEMVPASGEQRPLTVFHLTPGATGTGRALRLEGTSAALLAWVPRDSRITLRVRTFGPSAAFGLWLRAAGDLGSGYVLRILGDERRVTLNYLQIELVGGLDQEFTLDVVMCGSVIDTCIDGRRCLIDRCPELVGDRLAFYSRHGQVSIEDICVRPLLSRVSGG